MGSAHSLTERDIWVKLTINRSKGSEDIERTEDLRVNPTTLKCDLDLELSLMKIVQMTHLNCC